LNGRDNDISDTDEHPDNGAEKAPIAARIGTVVFGLIWLSGVLGGFSLIVSELIDELRKPLVYRPVGAIVTKYTPPVTKTDEFGDDASTDGVVEYRYTVAGRQHDGKHRQGGQFSNEHSQAAERTLKKGQKLDAWYDPDDPSRSTLAPVAEPQLLGFVIFMLPFLAVGAGMIFFGVTGRVPKFRPPRRRSSRGKGMSVNISRAGPYFGSFVGVCAVSAFVFFGVSMFLDWRTGWAVGVAWLVLGIPAVTFALGRFFSRRGKAKAAATEEIDDTETEPPAAQDEITGPEDRTKADEPSRKVGGTGYRKKLIGAAAFTLFWCAITGVFVGFVGCTFYKSYDAQKRFVTTEGEVLASKVKRHEGDSDSGPTYEALVKYRYTVDGSEYTSMRYSYGSMASSDRSHAAAVVKAHPKGRRVTVWYDPRKPAEAVLHVRVPTDHYFLLLFLQPFILVGLGGIVFTVTVPYRHRRAQNFLAGEIRTPWEIPEWGTLCDSARGMVLHRSRSPIFAFAMGYGLTCFLSIFIVGFFFAGFSEPDPAVIGIAILIAAGVGILAMTVSLRRRRAHFEIDDLAGTLHLKSSKREFTVDFTEIDHWFLKMVIRSVSTYKDSDSEDMQTAPLLALMTTAGEEMPVHVFGSSAEQRRIAKKVAREFARLTGKPFAGIRDGQELPEPPTTPSGVFSWMRARNKAAREYADLN